MDFLKGKGGYTQGSTEHINRRERESKNLKKQSNMARIAKGGYIQNGKVHKYRNLIMNADKWAQEKAEFLRSFYGCETCINVYPQSIQLQAYRKAQGRKKAIEITFYLDFV